MIVHNVRFGFANNSSSSHSIMFLKNVADDGAVVGDAFGWDNFTLSSKTSKDRYLAALIANNIRATSGEELALVVAQGMLGVSLDPEYYIDHQSDWRLPMDRRNLSSLNLKFAKDLIDHIRRDDVVILGGNDNDDSHPLSGQGVETPADSIPCEDTSVYVARKDLGYWTMFNTANGSKIRLSFDNAPAPDKASRPELVDLKITDYCAFGCAFCYQGSTTEGKHATFGSIKRIIRLLSEWEVFEIAIGGGEPTLHPNFMEILAYANKLGIKPNFTTKNLGWLKGPLGSKVLDAIGSFAYSVENVEDVNKLLEAMEPHIDSMNKVSIQYIVGLHDNSNNMVDIAELAQQNNIRITLLGYKTTKRGAAFGEKKNTNWIKAISNVVKQCHYGSPICIDTVLADKYYDELVNEYKVPKWCLTRRDGSFSAYIDAVTNRMYANSYVGDDVEGFELILSGNGINDKRALDPRYEDYCDIDQAKAMAEFKTF